MRYNGGNYEHKSPVNLQSYTTICIIHNKTGFVSQMNVDFLRHSKAKILIYCQPYILRGQDKKFSNFGSIPWRMIKTRH